MRDVEQVEQVWVVECLLVLLDKEKQVCVCELVGGYACVISGGEKRGITFCKFGHVVGHVFGKVDLLNAWTGGEHGARHFCL